MGNNKQPWSYSHMLKNIEFCFIYDKPLAKILKKYMYVCVCEKMDCVTICHARHEVLLVFVRYSIVYQINFILLHNGCAAFRNLIIFFHLIHHYFSFFFQDG